MSALKLPPPIVLRTETPRGNEARVGDAPARAVERELCARGSTRTEDPERAPAPVPVAARSAHSGKLARPDSPLFRHEALRAYQLGMGLSAPLRVVPLSSGLMLAALAALLLAALA